MFAHPELVPIALALAFMAGLFIITWVARPKAIRWPDDPWFSRLAMWGVRHWDDAPNASAFASAIARAGEWVHNAFTNHRLIEELNEVHGRLGRLLCEASGGKASKTNYDSEIMSGLVQEYQTEMLEDHMVDSIARLPNFEFSWPRIKVLCEHFEVSEGAVSERRKQIRDMDKLVKATARERARAAKHVAKITGKLDPQDECTSIHGAPKLKMAVTLTTEHVDARAALPKGNVFKHLVDSTN